MKDDNLHSIEDNDKLAYGKIAKNFFIAGGIGLIIALIPSLFVAVVRVRGNSMYPTYHEGQTVLMRKVFIDPTPGDIVVIDKDGIDIIKRVIGCVGDTIEIKSGKVFINGEYYAEDYTNRGYSTKEPITVTDGKVYVLGDNRKESLDSREYGLIDIKNIKYIAF